MPDPHSPKRWKFTDRFCASLAAMLVASFEIQIARPGIAFAPLRERKVGHSRFEPDVDDFVARFQFTATTMRALRPGGEFREPLRLEPRIAAMDTEQGGGALDEPGIDNLATAAPAEWKGERHAPDTLS